MNVVHKKETLNVTVSKNDLWEGRYLPIAKLGKIVDKAQAGSDTPYKVYLYNNLRLNKYKTLTKGDVRCIDAFEPNRTENCSLLFNFEIGD